MKIRYNSQGLIPAVVQDIQTGQVLMVAWMNAQSMELTQQTGQVYFWSRSRQEIWHKGATSGNFMNVKEILLDCDADTLLLKVSPEGPACHTGQRSCFFNLVGDEIVAEQLSGEGNMLEDLFQIIEDRKANRRTGSYTNHLLDRGEDQILQKIGEEAVEVILAAKGQGNQRLVEEMSDLIYHLWVLLSVHNLKLADIETELRQRHNKD